MWLREQLVLPQSTCLRSRSTPIRGRCQQAARIANQDVAGKGIRFGRPLPLQGAQGPFSTSAEMILRWLTQSPNPDGVPPLPPMLPTAGRAAYPCGAMRDLTPRQTEVLRLLAQGMTNRRIG